MVRAPIIDSNGIKKGAWSKEEDDKLRAYILEHGHWNWRQIPKLAGLQRCGKGCRLRWVNYLRPDIKRGNYSKEEEDLILELHEKLGNKWSVIAANLSGRTDNEIKNHWHTHLKKRAERTQNIASDHDQLKAQSRAEQSRAEQSRDTICQSELTITNIGEMEGDSSVSVASVSPAQLILQSSPLSTDTFKTDVSYSSADDSALVTGPAADATNRIAADNPANSRLSLEETSGEFWTMPFVVDKQEDSYALSFQENWGFIYPYGSCHDDDIDFLYQVLQEPPMN